ncbi:hypothetical protein C1893_15000 [Pseudomonas sp. MPR-ANC1]|nr:hypothetical protein C1893_15000 [Pseudomonas sp. MPR-ANC1]
MPSTLTAGGKDGKQSEKIERNTRKASFCAILLCVIKTIVWFFARGSVGAQLIFWGSIEYCGVVQAAFASRLAPTGDLCC